MARRQLVTLLTDFGTRDPYVAAMKGVLLSRCPRAEIVDISHEVPPQDVVAGAFILAEAARTFPEGTLHVVVVDPGVGTDRAILAGGFGEQRFLWPDNGVITFVAESWQTRELVTVSNTQYLPAGVSRTFHGRDIFAPVAAHILNGLDLPRLGPQPKTFTMLDLPQAAPDGAEMVGRILHVDRFGNLISNIPADAIEQWCPDVETVHVRCEGRDIGPLLGTYGHAEPGRPLALINSMDLLEVAVSSGRADEALGLGAGAEVRLRQAPVAGVG